MKYIVLCNVIGFPTGLLLVWRIARGRPILAWWVTIGSNIPTLAMLLSLSSGALNGFPAFGLLVGLGLGGFGLGSFAGATAILFGTEPPKWARGRLRKRSTRHAHSKL
ncbi:hypothetical protein [Bradyrhizobium cytisi]|uniref:Uncharacterized protein n=1 Tax=Bradyrhizobium cytisi TaxID=515489 RepID=A0A5S4XEB3_9BRAD|nr:hypothetical protein [Bradyrhizobium cytisi]TYL87820.1 hypothetical protein FXB38_03315 [Bradyrhizobium cytisi]